MASAPSAPKKAPARKSRVVRTKAAVSPPNNRKPPVIAGGIYRDDGGDYIYRASITLKNGKKLYASSVGLRAFKIRVKPIDPAE